MKINKYLVVIFFILMCCNWHSIKAQINGKVIDATTKEPLIGATVKIDDTKAGTITDVDGKFMLKTTNKSEVLTIRYIGYISKKVKWTDNLKTLTIEIASETQNLNDVVVIGYGVQKKSDLTGSVASIKSDEIKSLPTSSVAQALQGKAAGVEVVRNSGAPGASTSIRIRGMGTINNSEPLYVVDGVAMDDINSISSDDIASIEILKDASSSAIYGSRAANGVVLITLKSGKDSNKRPAINLSTYYGFQEVNNGPRVLTKEQYPYFSDFVEGISRYTIPNSPSFPFAIATRKQAIAADKNIDWTSALTAEGQRLVKNGENYWDLVTQTGPMRNVNLSVTGGDKNYNYYTSGGILKSDGIIKESNYQRINFNLKINTQLSKKVNLGVNVSYSREDKTNVPEGDWGIVQLSTSYNPLVPVIDTYGGGYMWTTPVEALRRSASTWYRNSMVGQLNLDWTISKGLIFNTRASYDYRHTDIDVFQRYNQNPEVINTIHDVVGRNPQTASNISWDNILNYNVTFGKNNLSAMVGQTLELSDWEGLASSGTVYGGYDTNYDAIDLAQYGFSTSGSTSSWRQFSFLGRISYDYAGKYLLQTNFRADASSRFSKNNRWGYFPSASVGWKISGEDFMQNIPTISFLKLRAGWGVLGNNRIDNYTYRTLVLSPADYIYGHGTPGIQPAYQIGQYGNPDILWESTQSVSFGIDLNLFKNRLTSSFEYFVKDTKDILIAVPIVYSAGYPNYPMQNAGSVRNKGFEVQLSWRDQIGEFRYEVGGNFTGLRNEVLSLGNSGDPIYGGNLGSPSPLGFTNITIEGAPIASFFGYKTAGLLQPSDFAADGTCLVPTFASTTAFAPGDMKFVDLNKDGVINDNDRTFLGSPQPNVYYGFNIKLGYKSFDLTAFFQGVSGNKIFNVAKYYLYSSVQYNGSWGQLGFSNVASDYFQKVYRTETSIYGPNTTGTVPTPRTDQSHNEINFRTSDFYIEDGSYLRLKNVQLTYTLPEKYCTKSKFLKTFKLYVAVNNLLTITKYTGLDPEVGQSSNLYNGIDKGTYPQCRSYMLGINAVF